MTWVVLRSERATFLTAALLVLTAIAAMAWDIATRWPGVLRGAVHGTLVFGPAVLGLSFGAMIVGGDFRRRTTRLLWAQSVPKADLLRQQVVVAGALVVAGSALAGALSPEWYRVTTPLQLVGPEASSTTGPAFVAAVLFGFAVGVALVVLLERPRHAVEAGIIPVFLTLGGVGYLKDHLLAPTERVMRGGPNAKPTIRLQSSAWITNQGYLPEKELVPTAHQSWNTFPRPSCFLTGEPTGTVSGWAETQRCVATDHLHYVVQLHPESQYWLLQLFQSGVFLALAAAALGLAAFVVRFAPD